MFPDVSRLLKENIKTWNFPDFSRVLQALLDKVTFFYLMISELKMAQNKKNR